MKRICLFLWYLCQHCGSAKYEGGYLRAWWKHRIDCPTAWWLSGDRK